MAKKTIQPTKHHCYECKHSYDWHEIGADGQPFLCRCPFYTDGKYCLFLKRDGCTEHFIPR